MRSIIFLITIFVVSIQSSSAKLDDDLRQLADLVPKTKIVAIAAKHFLFDKEFRNFKSFIESKEFSDAWDILIFDKDFRAAVEYSQTSGFDVINTINQIANYLKIQQYPKLITVELEEDSVQSFIDEVVGSLPKPRMSGLMKEKMVTSPEFKHFIEVLTSEHFINLVSVARNSPNLAGVIQLLQSKGLHADHVLNIGRDFLSWAK